MMYNKVEKNKPNRVTRCTESFSTTRSNPSVIYRLDLSNMPTLKASHLQKSIGTDEFTLKYTKAHRWLDDIYDNVK